MIVLDACVPIAYLDGSDEDHERADTLLAREIDDEFAISSLTMAEVLVAPARDGQLDDVLAIVNDLEIRELEFPAETGTKLARVRADTMLKMPDCCVLLAAEDNRARLASFDERLLRAAQDRGVIVVDR